MVRNHLSGMRLKKALFKFNVFAMIPAVTLIAGLVAINIGKKAW